MQHKRNMDILREDHELFKTLNSHCKNRKEAIFGGLYPAPLIHMDSMWNLCGIHVVPHGICPFHMDYVLAEISPILVISFHLYSMWIPCGFYVNSTIPHGISTRNPYGMFHMNSHVDSMWKDGFHVDSMRKDRFHVDSMWIPPGIPNNQY